MSRCSIFLGDSGSLWIVVGFFRVIVGHYGLLVVVGGCGSSWNFFGW